MGRVVSFTILGEPKGKGRPRFSRQNGRTYTPPETVAYENLVKIEYRRQCGSVKFLDETPIDARITAYFQIPKSVSKKKRQAMIDRKIRPTKKCDCDNICKIILDSLNGIAFRDDSMVVDCQIRKFYSEEPRVVVKLQEAKTLFD